MALSKLRSCNNRGCIVTGLQAGLSGGWRGYPARTKTFLFFKTCTVALGPTTPPA